MEIGQKESHFEVNGITGIVRRRSKREKRPSHNVVCSFCPISLSVSGFFVLTTFVSVLYFTGSWRNRTKRDVERMPRCHKKEEHTRYVSFLRRQMPALWSLIVLFPVVGKIWPEKDDTDWEIKQKVTIMTVIMHHTRRTLLLLFLNPPCNA